MQTNQEVLYKIARDYVARRTRGKNDIVSIYLTGSILREDPLLGGTTDIDMVIVHKETPVVEREVQRVSYEISLDIQHHAQSFYAFHRRLRLNPWLGEALCSHESVLYDSGHWFDFIQAGVSAQYMAPETIYSRALPFAEKARQEWFELDDPQQIGFSEWVDLYFKAVYTAANAIAILAGPALTTRRLLLDFPSRAEAIDRLSLTGDLNRLISGELGKEQIYQTWRPAWEDALVLVSKNPSCPPNLSNARKAYFLQSADAMVSEGNTHAAFWPMLESWRGAMQLLRKDEEAEKSWHSFLTELGFNEASKEACSQRLDKFIDSAEIMISDWKSHYNI